ncbi:MAG TPA: BON domain-containing protein [Vicinamibacterales bacterium]|nr:BON domain-containing protein [Vicinamibacterales bacterium]
MLLKSFSSAALFAAFVVTASPAPAAAQARTSAPASPAVTDDSIKDRVNYRLETSNVVRKYDVKVKVEKGVVTLSGDVATAAQKAEAGRLAKVTGVTRVQNDIAVDPNEDKTVTERVKSGLTKTGEKITDAWITTKVKWFFLGEDALKGSDINVDTANHVVTLKGTVKSAAGKARAMQLAKNTDGVTKVVDQLMIK